MYSERPMTFDEIMDYLKFVAEGEGQISEQDKQTIVEIKTILKKYDKIKFEINVWLLSNNIPDYKALVKISDIIDGKDYEENNEP